MSPITIVTIILLIAAICACSMMVYSIKGYNEKFREMSARNRELVKKVSSTEQQLQLELQKKSPVTGRSDSAELQELRRQIATLTRRGEETERIQLECNKYKEHCRRLAEQVKALREGEMTPDASAAKIKQLEAELQKVKEAYGKLLEEHNKRRPASTGTDNSAAVENAALSVELSRVMEENAQLTREKLQLEEKLEASGSGDTAQTDALMAELNRVKRSAVEQLQEQERLKAALEASRTEITNLRGELQQRESDCQMLAAKLKAAEAAAMQQESAARQAAVALEKPAPTVAVPVEGERREDKYLAMALDPRKLDAAGKIRFLNVLFMLDGSVKLSGSTNIRLSEIALLENGAAIPNPYFYRRFGADGELGSDIRKVRHVMQFAEPDLLRRYRLTAMRPAKIAEEDGAYRLVQPGELMLG